MQGCEEEHGVSEDLAEALGPWLVLQAEKSSSSEV